MPVVIALDIGERRTGVAVGSSESGLARPHGVFYASKRESFARRLRQIVAETGAELVVVGCPHQPDGSISTQGERIRRFVAGFATEVSAPIVFWDESLSTVDAQAALSEARVGRRRRRNVEDAVAAAVFLQQYLDAQRRASLIGQAPQPPEGG